MKLKLIRKFKGTEYTIGDLYVDGNFFCNTIEDKVRTLPETCPDTAKFKPCTCKEKVYAETAILEGIYKITMEYSKTFKKVLPYLHNIPHFLGILIHSGNTQHHTKGCIIVGRNTVVGKVIDSLKTLALLIRLIEKETDISIEII
ncbi:MAG: DUF5675 family protein [Odoribacter sp.]|nr:DUF5675 family protein [Odoribacter sp.]